MTLTIHFLLLTDILWANTWLVPGSWPGLDILQIPTFWIQKWQKLNVNETVSKKFKIEVQDINVIPQCKETGILLQQNDTQSKQHIGVGVDLTFTCKMVLLLLVYNSALVHNSLIPLSTGTTKAGFVGLLLWVCKIKKLIFYLKHMVLTTSWVPDLYLISTEEKHAFLFFHSFHSFSQRKATKSCFLLHFAH